MTTRISAHTGSIRAIKRGGPVLSPHDLDDDFEWADRSEYWLNYRPARRGARKKFYYREPLILCGHGISIRVDHNTLLIRHGLTHYPQKIEQTRFFPGDANLPDRIIILDGNGGITFDALDWMSEQRIGLVKLDWRGEITSMGGGAHFSANSKLAEIQRQAKVGKKSAKLARWLIGNKILASTKTLREIIPDSPNRENAISKLEKRYSEIRNSKKSLSTNQILGIEGDCAAAYFRAWLGAPIKWSGIKQKPIPQNWLEVVPRNMFWRRKAQNARHPLNAMLNYGYGVLKIELKNQVIGAGLDPSIGIMHGNFRSDIPLVLDLMEPVRPAVDRAILAFALSNVFTPEDFTISQVGGCRINPQMAKEVVRRVKVSDYVRPIVNQVLSVLRS